MGSFAHPATGSKFPAQFPIVHNCLEKVFDNQRTLFGQAEAGAQKAHIPDSSQAKDPFRVRCPPGIHPLHPVGCRPEFELGHECFFEAHVLSVFK